MPRANLLLLMECYGHPFPQYDAEHFTVWIAIASTPHFKEVRDALREQAKQNLITVGRNKANMDSVRGLIGFLQSGNCLILDEVSWIIRKHHAANLLRDPHYWEEVRNDRYLLWLHRDHLGPKTDNNPNTAPNNNDNGVPNNIANYDLNYRIHNGANKRPAADDLNGQPAKRLIPYNQNYRAPGGH